MKISIRMASQVLLCSLVVALSACATFHVVSPDPGDVIAHVNGWIRNATDNIEITVVFSEPVDSTTVVAGTTIYLETPTDGRAGGSVTWIDAKTLKFTSAKTAGLLLSPRFTTDAFFGMKILGNDTGGGVVKALGG